MANLIPFKKSNNAIIKADKFLPRIKTSFISSGKDSAKLVESPLLKIERKVIKIDSLLKDSLLLSKKENEKGRVKKEEKKFEQREKELENKKAKLPSGVKVPSLPGVGILGWIRNFVVQTVLGFLAVRLIDHLPKLLKVLPVIVKVGDFFIDMGGKLLDGLVTFVDKAYDVVDNTRKFTKQLGGEGLAQNFDKFAGALSTMLDVAVIAALSAASMGGDGGGGAPGGRGGRPKVTTGRGGKPGLGRSGPRVTQGKGGIKGFRFPKIRLPKIPGLSSIKKVLGPLSKLGKFGKIIPGLAAVIGITEGLSRLGEGDYTGALLSFGTAIPIAGWAFFAMDIAREMMGKSSFDSAVGGAFGGTPGLTDNQRQRNQGRSALSSSLTTMSGPSIVTGLSGGGQPTTRGGKLVGGPAKRSVKKKKTPRTLTVTPKKLKPGSAVGGENKVKQLFPETKNKTKMSPFDVLKNAYDGFSKSSGLGSLIALAIKPLMGDRPTYADYKNAGIGVNNWMNQSIASGTYGYAGGGEVKMESVISGEDYSDVIAKSLQDSVTPQVDKTIQDLMRQLTLKKVTSDEEDKKKKESEEQITPTDGMQDATLSDSEMNLFQRLVLAESGGQGKVGMALVARSVLNRAGLIQSGKASLGTFNAKDKTVSGVIMGPNQYQPIRDGSINRERTQAQMDSAKEAIKLAQNPDQLRAALKAEGMDDGSINKLIAATGFRTGSAFTDPSQNVNVVKYKDHYFNTAGNKGLIVASSQVSEYSGEKISGVGGGGGKAMFGETGNVSNSPGWVHGHFQGSSPNNVVRDTAGVVKALLRQGSPVYLNPGVDLTPGKKYSDAEILKFVEGARRAHTHSGTGSSIDVFVKRGTKVPVSLTNIGPSGSGYGGYGRGGLAGYISGTSTWIGHLDPSSASGSKNTRVASKFHGGIGYANKDGMTLKLHKGEMYKVVDKDSVDLFGRDFIEDIINIENRAQLVARAPSIIEKLKSISGYTDYENPEPEVVYVPVPMPSQDSGGGYGEMSKPSLSYTGSSLDSMGEQMSDSLMYG